MLIDGPADDLDFDDEEFIGGSYHNRMMYRRRKTKNLVSSIILITAVKMVLKVL